MANLPEISQWETGVYQLEETDVVRGGPVADGGISNRQAQELGNRTKFLYDRLDKVGGVSVKTISADTTLNNNDLYGQHIMLSLAAANKIVTLEVSSLPDNAVIALSAVQQAVSAVPLCAKIQLEAGIALIGGRNWYQSKWGAPLPALKDRLWLYGGESIAFIKSDSKLYLTEMNDSLDEVGEILYKPGRAAYALEAKGQLVNRADYPRLWQWVVDNGMYATDPDWLSSMKFSGLFSSGNATTNFRMPDLRGMFLRGTDNGRGIDYDREYNMDGGYQTDAFKKHSHSVDDRIELDTSRGYLKGQWFYGDPGRGTVQGTAYVNDAGGVESRPKNIVYTAYIRF